MRNPLHELDTLHASEETKVKTLAYVIAHAPKRRYYPMVKGIGVCVVAALILLSIWQPWQTQRSITPSKTPNVIASTVTLDINPSIELSLNTDLQVVSTKAYNKDAKQILNQVDIQHKEIDDALQLLFADEEYRSYLAQGILEIGVYAQDSALQQKLEQLIDSYMEEAAVTQRYHCASIDEETHAAAQTHHTSQGKYRVIDLIRSYDDTYSVDELTHRSMAELYALLEEYDDTLVPEGCHSNTEGGHHGKNHHDE